MVFFRFQYTKLEKYWYVPIFPNLSIIMILGFRNHQYCWIDLASLCLMGTVPLKYNDPGFRGNSRSAVRFIWQLSSGNGCLSLVQFFLLCPTLEQMETKWATMMAVWLFRLRAGQGQNGPPPVRVVKTELHGPAFWLLAAKTKSKWVYSSHSQFEKGGSFKVLCFASLCFRLGVSKRDRSLPAISGREWMGAPGPLSAKWQAAISALCFAFSCSKGGSKIDHLNSFLMFKLNSWWVDTSMLSFSCPYILRFHKSSREKP